MDLSKILTISGKNGLFKVVTQSKSGLIVESLSDGKRLPVFASDRSSSLEDISIFTTGEDVPLKQVLLTIFEKENGKPSIDAKSDQGALRAKFEEILPDYDRERVYASDIKKVFAWYALLLEKGLITVAQEDQEAEEASPAEQQSEPASSTHSEEVKTKEKKAAPAKPSKKKTPSDKTKPAGKANV